MKEIHGIKYYKIGEVAKKIERSTQAIKIWYEFAEQNKDVDLPPYRTDLDAKGIRYWKEEDIPKLINFRDNLKRGMMSDFNVKKWGSRGKEIIERGTQYGTKRFEQNETK